MIRSLHLEVPFTAMKSIHTQPFMALPPVANTSSYSTLPDFMFRLTDEEFESLRSQNVTSKRGGRRYLPFAFTEHGAIMAATILNSPEAVAMSVFVVRAFMQMREQLAANAAILKRLAEIDKTLLEHDSALRTIWTKLQPLLAPPPDPPKRRIGFNRDKE